MHVTGKIIYGEITDREGVISCLKNLVVDDCFSDEAQNNDYCCRGDNLSGAASQFKQTLRLTDRL